MIKKTLLILITLVVCNGLLLAQEKKILTIEQAIEIGMQNSTAFRTSQFKVQAADAKASEVNTLGLPSLKLDGELLNAVE